MSVWRQKAPTLFGALVALAACISFVYIYSGCCLPRWMPIRADGFGYYAYLPSAFIDHDLTMRTALANRGGGAGLAPVFPGWDGIAKYPQTGRPLDKYTMGTALLQVPFFLAAHAAALAFHLPPYSLPYQIGAVLSSLIFLTLGSLLLLRMLLRHFPLWVSGLSACAVIFGTSLFHDATFLPSYSHVYSFFLFALLLTVCDSYSRRGAAVTSRPILVCAGLGAITGLIALVRVPNVIAAILPLALVCERFIRSGNRRSLVLELSSGMLAFLFVFSIQVMYWHAVTGRFVLNPYQGEHFNWLAPQIWNFLFSIRRGLFVWSPVVLIAAAGLPLLVRRDKPLGFAVCAVLALEVYICSSWWSWWFGDSFGSRPIADMAPLIALPLASSLEWIGGRTFRFVPAAIVTCLIGLNLFLMVSYWNELFPWDDVTATDLLRLPLNWENHHLLVSDVRRRLALATPYTPGTTFRADTGAPPGMWLQGFTERRGLAAWTIGKRASVEVRLAPTSGDLRLIINFAKPGGLFGPQHPRQRAIIAVNGGPVGKIEMQYGEDNRMRSLVVPARFLRGHEITHIDLTLPDAAAPKTLGTGADPRLLAFYVSEIALVRAPTGM